MSMTKPLPNLNLLDIAAIDDLIGYGVVVGTIDRAAYAVSPQFAEHHKSDATRLRHAIKVRIASVLGDMPNKVQRAVSATVNDHQFVRVPVMELTYSEYPVGAKQRSSHFLPVEQLTPDNLEDAGFAVFDALSKLSRNPELGYRHNGDTRTQSLCIYITVHAPNRQINESLLNPAVIGVKADVAE
jgi:hypothetical protein